MALTACSTHGSVRAYDFRGPWFRSDEAAAYVQCRHRCGCPSAKAFWNWRQRHGVVSIRGLIAKADLDRVMSDARRQLRAVAS